MPSRPCSTAPGRLTAERVSAMLTVHVRVSEGAGHQPTPVRLRISDAAGPGLLAFSGTRAALEAPGCAVAVNTLNAHPTLGTVGLLNSHRPVYPLRFGAPGADDWSVADWCDQCHRKAGLVTWPDLPRL